MSVDAYSIQNTSRPYTRTGIHTGTVQYDIQYTYHIDTYSPYEVIRMISHDTVRT